MNTELDEYFMNPDNVSDMPNIGDRQVTPKEFYSLIEPEQERAFVLMKRINCKDGFSMSVQANQGAYCSPRITIRSEHSNYYNHYEVGYPSAPEDLLMPYIEDKEAPTETVYGYVPKSVIEQVIAKHGGINLSKPPHQ